MRSFTRRTSRSVAPWVTGLAMSVACATAAAQSKGTPPSLPPTPPGTPASPSSDRTLSTVDLRPRFVSGRSTRYVLEIDSNNRLRSTSSTDLDQDQQQRDALSLVLRVKEAGAGGAVLELVYERVRSSLKTPDFDISADSAAAPSGSNKPGTSSSPGATPSGKPTSTPTSRPATKPATAPSGKPGSPGSPSAQPQQPAGPRDPLADIADINMQELLRQHVAQIAGTVLTIKTDAGGNITSVTGGERLSGGGLGALAGLSGLGGAGAGLNPSAVANWVVGGVGAPADVRVGQTWSTSANLAGTPVGSFELRTRSTLSSALAGQAQIAFKGQAETNSSSALVLPGFQLRSASYSGTAQWDTRQGELAGMNAVTNVAISGNVGGLAAELTSRQTVKVTRER